MELLFLVVVSALFPLVFLEIFSAVSLLVTVISLIPDLIIAVFLLLQLSRKEARQQALNSHPSWKRVRGVLRVAAYGAGSGCLVLLIVNLFFFAPATRLILEKAAARKGITLTVDQIEGNLFTGSFKTSGLSIIRPRNERAGLDIRIESVALQTSVWGFLVGERSIEQLSVRGVTGTISQRDEAPRARRVTTSSVSAPQQSSPDAPTRPVSIGSLHLSAIDVTLAPVRGEPVRITITEGSVTPFRTHLAAFDLFFRSSVDGAIDGTPFNVVTRERNPGGSGLGRDTIWSIKELPVARIGSFIGRAPLSWFTEGTISLEARDRWQLDRRAEIDMDWHITVRDLRVASPADATLVQRALALSLSKLLILRSELDISFTLRMNEQQFEGGASLDAAGLWSEVSRNIMEGIERIADKTE